MPARTDCGTAPPCHHSIRPDMPYPTVHHIHPPEWPPSAHNVSTDIVTKSASCPAISYPTWQTRLPHPDEPPPYSAVVPAPSTAHSAPDRKTASPHFQSHCTSWIWLSQNFFHWRSLDWSISREISPCTVHRVPFPPKSQARQKVCCPFPSQRNISAYSYSTFFQTVSAL